MAKSSSNFQPLSATSTAALKDGTAKILSTRLAQRQSSAPTPRRQQGDKIYQKYHEALQDAQLSISAVMGDFTGAFAPKLKAKDESTIVKIFLDVLAFGIGISSAGLWNIVIHDAAIFATSAYRSFAKDTFNSAISSSFALAKDTTKA
ncbi:hypothetical protein CBS470a_006270 [Colletotrichum nupharicola]|nr:hypothetical protein CBS470a_006270 [Colletotrichum nupharicola]